MALLAGFLTSPFLWAVIALVVVFGIAVFATGALRTHSFEAERGITALCAMKWQDFAALVTTFLGERGLRRGAVDHRPGEGGFDLLLERGTSRYLVVCRNAATQHVTAQTVSDLQKKVQHEEAEGALILSAGPADAGAIELARSRSTEVIAGATLWRQVKHLLPFDVRDDAEAGARRERKRRLLRALGIAVIAALLAWVAVRFLVTPEPKPAPPATRPAVTAPAATPATPPPAPAATTPAPATPAAAQLPDPTLSEAQQDTRRAQSAAEVRTLPGIADAVWSTKSTLVLSLSGAEDSITEVFVADICRVLLQYEEQRFSRLQLEVAPSTSGIPESGEVQPPTVRWRQCR